MPSVNREPVRGLVVIVVVVLVRSLTELLTPQSYANRHVSVQGERDECRCGQPPVVEAYIKHDHLHSPRKRHCVETCRFGTEPKGKEVLMGIV